VRVENLFHVCSVMFLHGSIFQTAMIETEAASPDIVSNFLASSVRRSKFPAPAPTCNQEFTHSVEIQSSIIAQTGKSPNFRPYYRTSKIFFVFWRLRFEGVIQMIFLLCQKANVIDELPY